METQLLSLAGVSLNTLILVLVIVNHIKMKSLCKSVRHAHERIDRHLEGHTRPE